MNFYNLRIFTPRGGADGRGRLTKERFVSVRKSHDFVLVNVF